MMLFSADAIPASSTLKFGIEIPRVDRQVTQKFGPRVPLIEREDLRSSTSLIDSITSVGNCEQVHTSVLNLIFQQANVVGVGNLSK